MYVVGKELAPAYVRLELPNRKGAIPAGVRCRVQFL